eukprot:2554201-Alexandrium_andersonii.AAC.1
MTQRVFQIIYSKQKYEKKTAMSLSNRDVAQMYTKKLIMADHTDEISESFVKVTLRVWQTIYMVPAAKKIILEADEEFGSQATPFDSVYKLEAISQKVANESELVWVLEGLTDM